MTTLIFVDKPAVARIVLNHLPADIDPQDAYVVHMLLTGPARMQFVRGKPMSAYPLIAEPRFTLNENVRYAAHPVATYAKGLQDTIAVTNLPAVHRIVYAVDPDHSGIWAFRTALSLWFGDDAAHAPHEAWLLTGLDERSVKAALGAKTTTAALEKSYDYACTKRYFEYQWTNNGHAVLALNGIGAPSKFGLQLLYFLRQQAALLSEGQLVACMERWCGTGKYPCGEMGSPASRASLLEQLRILGFVVHTKNGVALSDQGNTLLARLHPGYEDLDLPLRLDQWCTQGLAASKPSIDKYIRTVFGKQLRFAARAQSVSQ